jgi:hypothetical protein
VIAVFDLPTIHASIAAINRDAVLASDRFLAIQSSSECAGDGFEFFDLMSGKEIGVRQSSAFERTLQQLDTLLLIRKIFECHRAFIVTEAERWDN